MDSNEKKNAPASGKLSNAAAILGVIALVLGIVFIIYTPLMLLWFVPLIMGSIGIILAALGRKKEQKTTFGLMTSIVALMLGLFLAAGCVAGCIRYSKEELGDEYSSYSQFRRDADGNIIDNGGDAPELSVD